MKEKLSHAAGYLLFFVMFSTTSCKKIIDEIVKHPSKGVVEDCRIEKIITQYGSASYYDTAYFTYNNVGNPKMIRHSFYSAYPDQEEMMDAVFKYDNKNRLRVWIQGSKRLTSAGRDTAHAWHFFTYEGNKIIRKTYIDASAPFTTGDAYNSVSDAPDRYHPGSPSTQIFTTDEFGRIISLSNPPSTATYNFNYDAAGNLVGEDFEYGSNYSYLQTNKVWMLMALNYSVNNKTAPIEWWQDDYPVEFNSRKLPTKFSVYYPFIFDNRSTSIFMFNDDTQMIYKCK